MVGARDDERRREPCASDLGALLDTSGEGINERRIEGGALPLKRLLASLALFAAVAAGCGDAVGAQPAPLDNPVGVWIREIHSPDLLARRGASRAPATLGSNPDAAVSSIVRLLADPDRNVRKLAADALGEHQTAAPQAVAALVRALNDRDAAVRAHAVIALAKIGPPAVAPLVTLVRAAPKGGPPPPAEEEDTPHSLAYATFALERIGPEAARVILAAPPRTQTTDDETSFALNSYQDDVVGGQPNIAAQAYRRFLGAADETTRLAAISGLGDLGAKAQIASPELARLLLSGSPQERRAAAGALREAGPGASVATPALIETLKSADGALRLAAVTALGAIGERPDVVVPTLAALLNDRDADLVDASVSALAAFGARASSTCPAVRSLLDRADVSKEGVVEAMASVCSGDPDAVASVVLAASDSAVEGQAFETLGSLGPAGFAELARFARNGDADHRFRALKAAAHIEPPTADVISLMTDALSDRDDEIARRAAVTLGEIGPAARSAAPTIIAQYRAGRSRATLNCALQGIGPAAADALPVLKDVASDKASYDEIEKAADKNIGCDLGSTFVDIGAASIPALVDLLMAPHFAADAMKALARIGGAPPAAAPVLASLLRDPDLAGDAAELLARMGEAALPEVAKALANPNPATRQGLIERVGHSDAPCTFLAAVGRPLLHDPDPLVRIAAGRALAKCPDAATEVTGLRQDSDRSVRAAAALIEIGGPEAAYVRLLKRFERGAEPFGSEVAYAFTRLGAQSAPYLPALRRQLASPNEGVAARAAELMVDLGADDVPAISLLQDGFLETFVDDAVRAVERRTAKVHYHRGGRPDKELPQLPWPVPKPSNLDVVDKSLFGDARTLGDVYAMLAESLKGVGFTEYGVFAAPSGFAIATPVERVHAEDMTSFAEPDRWTSAKLPLRDFSLSQYLISLFLDHPGQFRLFVFLVSDKPPELATQEMNEQDARDLAMRGGKTLPASIASASFSDLQCYALLYHFERKIGGEAAELSPSPFRVREHLIKAGLKHLVD